MAYDKEETVNRVVELLEQGKTLLEISRMDGMPQAKTIYRWGNQDGELGERIREAWEIGFITEGERAYLSARLCSDPQKAKVMLEAAKWHLGHRSHAYAHKRSVGVQVNVEADSTFDAIAGLLEAASAALSGGRQSTYVVDGDGKARPINAGNQLPHLAADRGSGLREDPGGSSGCGLVGMQESGQPDCSHRTDRDRGEERLHRR